MKTEEQVCQLFAEENPIPRGEILGLGDVRTGRLEPNEQRRSGMIDLDTIRREQRKSSIIPWLAAAIVIVVAGVAVFLTSQGSEEDVVMATPDNLSPEARVELLLTTRDYATLTELVTEDWLTARFPESLGQIPETVDPEDWAEYWRAEEVLGVTRDLEGCLPVSETTLHCDISYSSRVSDAMGDPALVETRTFVFEDDRLDVGDLPTDTRLLARFGDYASRAGLQDEFLSACPGGGLTEACATLIIQSLDSWVASVDAGD